MCVEKTLYRFEELLYSAQYDDGNSVVRINSMLFFPVDIKFGENIFSFHN